MFELNSHRELYVLTQEKNIFIIDIFGHRACFQVYVRNRNIDGFPD